MGSKGGGGSQPKPAAQVSYRKERAREEVMGTGKKGLGARYMQTRRATPTAGGGFGGQKPTLG